MPCLVVSELLVFRMPVSTSRSRSLRYGVLLALWQFVLVVLVSFVPFVPAYSGAVVKMLCVLRPG